MDNATVQLSASKSSDGGMTYGYVSEIQRYQMPKSLKFQESVASEVVSTTVIKKRRVDFERAHNDMIEDASESDVTPEGMTKTTPVLLAEVGA